MKEKLLTNYGETMKLKADTGNSYCECSGSGTQKCFFNFRKITLSFVQMDHQEWS